MTAACELSPARIAAGNSGRLDSLPLVTLYLTERCNSRCISCDYWRHGRKDMTLDEVKALLPSLRRLHTRAVLISGGEPLVNPEWQDIAALLAMEGLQLWLLTSGLALAKHAARAARWFAAITVSLDGACAETYRAIRGVDAFDKVCEGIRAAVATGSQVNLRTTVQRLNFRELPACVALAHELGVRQISLLAADVGNPHTFGRQGSFNRDLALSPDELCEFARVLDTLQTQYAAEFAARFIAEEPAKLRRIFDYYTAICGLGTYPPVRCNAPEFSAVIGADGRIQPCFFIDGPTQHKNHEFDGGLNAPAMVDLRTAIREGRRPECKTCVCSSWRELSDLDETAFFAPSLTQ